MKGDPLSGGGKAAGPFSGQAAMAVRPHELDNERAVRARALDLAVQTVQRVTGFTNYQVVHTADLYAKYISDGLVPPRAQVAPEEEPREESDGSV